MPYKSTAELPKGVKNHLPEHAQQIYKEAFNSADKEYADPAKRRGSESLDETAAKVAWSAVKKDGYKKGPDGNWHPSK